MLKAKQQPIEIAMTHISPHHQTIKTLTAQIQVIKNLKADLRQNRAPDNETIKNKIFEFLETLQQYGQQFIHLQKKSLSSTSDLSNALEVIDDRLLQYKLSVENHFPQITETQLNLIARLQCTILVLIDQLSNIKNNGLSEALGEYAKVCRYFLQAADEVFTVRALYSLQTPPEPKIKGSGATIIKKLSH